jgi:fructoselysine 3-epimerase
MKLSISSFLYYNYPLEEAIKRISGCGYQGIEIWGGRPHAYRNDLTEDEILNLRKLLERSQLEISAFIPAQFRYPTSLCSPNAMIREDSVNYIKDSIATSLKLGCHKVSICPGHTLYGQGYENGIEQLGESIRELHKFAHKKDVTLLIEPAHRFESDLILTIKDGIEFILRLGLDNLGIALDTGHCFVNKESLVDCVSLLKGFPYHIHLDDNHGISDDHKVPGEGKIDFLPFLRELKTNGYDGFLTLELGWNYTLEPDSAAIKSRENIEALLREV